jgi:hypothetical protein
VLYLRPHPSTRNAIKETLAKPVAAIKAFAKKAPGLAWGVYEQHIVDVFDAEGIPPWQALALRTILERLWLGFPPEHPILQRTGSFKRAFLSGEATEQLNLGGQSMRLRFGVSDPRFLKHQEGRRYLPARPIAPDTAPTRRALCIKMEPFLLDGLEDCIRDA